MADEIESLPTRGAWIEIDEERAIARMVYGRSPHGERGLKWHAHGVMHGAPVAPHTGSVD